MKNNNALKLTFDDALFITLFGSQDRKETMDRLTNVCTAFHDEDLQTRAFVLIEQVGKISDYVWPELYRQTKRNMDKNLELDRFVWDVGDAMDEEGDACVS